jgi:Pyruvate/2-oxoacid:ferredoxin oxidoreductase gamma subunit
MTKMPNISLADSIAHKGETAAVIKGKIIAYGKDCIEANRKAIELGYKENEIWVVYIMGPGPCVVTSHAV